MTYNEQICYINTTFKCNQKCIFCVSNETVHAMHVENHDEISLDTFSQILKSLPQNISTVHISGGEPLLHPHICDILKLADARFKNIQLLTNGIQLANIKNLEKIINVCTPEFVIPVLTTSPIIHNELTHTNSWKYIIKALKNISDLKSKFANIVLTIKLILLKKNLNDISIIPDFLSKNNILVDSYLLTGLCRTTEAINSGLVATFPEAMPSINDTLRKFITNKVPFCVHRIPLCAMDEELWPYVMTLSDSDRAIEKASALTVYPNGDCKTITPHKLETDACADCDLKLYCEIASSRNSQFFDYSFEFTPIHLEHTRFQAGS